MRVGELGVFSAPPAGAGARWVLGRWGQPTWLIVVLEKLAWLAYMINALDSREVIYLLS